MTPSLLEALARPWAHPHDPDADAGVEVVQTHLSQVFLTRRHVYKLHRDVDVGFVSFTSQAERNADALRELRLNRRLAPDVYLGLAPVEEAAGGFRVGRTVADPERVGAGEHCIVMRRLPEGRDARSLLEAGALGRDAVARVATRLARFHREHGLGRPSPFPPDEWLERIAAPVRANFASLRERSPAVVDADDVERLRERADAALARLAPLFERRRVDGRAVDGHGDLHLSHVWLEDDDAEPLVIDCIAFDEALRRIDAASDLAFLAMDLRYRDAPDLAEQLLAVYAAAADDHDLYRVIDFYVAYRAAVRAKVAALEATDPEIPEAQRRGAVLRARRRVAFATEALAPRPPGRVVLVGGIIGTGKSTVARALARQTGAVVLASDVVRGAPESEPGDAPGWRRGRYAPDATRRVYDALIERAEAVATSGRPVILDASWARRERRDALRAAAQAWGAPAVFVEVRCPRDVTLARLEARRRRGGDPSEAGPELYDDFAASFEAPDEWPAGARRVVDSTDPDWEAKLLSTPGLGREAPA